MDLFLNKNADESIILFVLWFFENFIDNNLYKGTTEVGPFIINGPYLIMSKGIIQKLPTVSKDSTEHRMAI